MRAIEKCSVCSLYRLIFAIERTNSNVVIRNLSLNFQCQTFRLAILTHKRSKNANITIAMRLEVRYLQLNSATANAVRHDLDLHFQCQEI